MIALGAGLGGVLLERDDRGGHRLAVAGDLDLARIEPELVGPLEADLHRRLDRFGLAAHGRRQHELAVVGVGAEVLIGPGDVLEQLLSLGIVRGGLGIGRRRLAGRAHGDEQTADQAGQEGADGREHHEVRSLFLEEMGIQARSGQGPFPAGTQAKSFVITETGRR